MLMPDELQNLVPVMSATTIPAPRAMAELSSSPIRSAFVISISAGMVTTTGWAPVRARRLERPIGSSPPAIQAWPATHVAASYAAGDTSAAGRLLLSGTTEASPALGGQRLGKQC